MRVRTHALNINICRFNSELYLVYQRYCGQCCFMIDFEVSA